MNSLTAEIHDMLEHEYVDYLGFADLSAYGDELVKFGGPIVTGYRYGISIGIALADSIVDRLVDGIDENVLCEYKTHCYHIVNDRLNLASSKLSSFLNRKGHRTLPIPAAERTNEGEAIPTVSHKMIAHIAGLGWIGKSCLLITPDRGPRVRFVSLLTNAPVDGIDDPMEERCGGCTECMRICPAGAIKGVNYVEGSRRDDRLDFRRCQTLFEDMKKRMKWEVCGLCLSVCPYGRK